jgi:hypothetical protein
MTNAEIEAKRAAEIEDIVARVMRAMVDLTVEEKRKAVTEIDRLVAYEEAGWAAANKQQH